MDRGHINDLLRQHGASLPEGDAGERLLGAITSIVEQVQAEARADAPWLAVADELCREEGITEGCMTDRLVSAREEVKASHTLRERLGALLDSVALPLKGPAAPNTMHSWHDLPEVAQAMADRSAQLREVALSSISRAVQVALGAATVQEREALVLAHPTYTHAPDGRLVAVSLQDDEHRMLHVLWQDAR